MAKPKVLGLRVGKEILLTTTQVAALYGVTPRAVAYATRKKLLPAHRLGWVWVYCLSELPKVWPIAARGR